jgi:hypothetical protein
MEGVMSGGGSLDRGKGQLHGGETDYVEVADMGVLAEAASLVESLGHVISPKFVTLDPKTLSPSKIGNIGGSHSAPGGQVSPPHSVRMFNDYLIYMASD